MLLLTAIGIAFMAARDGGSVVPGAASSPPPVAPVTPPAGVPAPALPSITGLHSRFSGRSTVEVWGAVAAPDGTTVGLVVRGSGGRRAATAPVRSGRFYAAIPLPAALQGQRVRIRARVRP